MRRFLPIVFIIIIFISGIAMLKLVILVANRHLNAPSKNTATVNCPTTKNKHTVTIENGIATPAITAAHLCDSLTITNTDNRVREMAFGEHESHEPYDGTAEKFLQQGGSLSVTLNQAGSFKFHDHIDDQAQGSFVVN